MAGLRAGRKVSAEDYGHDLNPAIIAAVSEPGMLRIPYGAETARTDFRRGAVRDAITVGLPHPRGKEDGQGSPAGLS